MTAEPWTARPERSYAWVLRLVIAIARLVGRSMMRILLHLIVFYYVLLAPGARAASRDYLTRVLGQPPGWRQIYRHFYSFSATILDRVYMFSGKAGQLDVRPHNREVLERQKAANTGAIIVVAHLGSYEVLRVLGAERGGLRLRVMMDAAAGAKTNAAIHAINPELADNIIDTSGSDVDRILKIKAALDAGEMLCLMADRHHPGERVADCRFLDGVAAFPLSPWLLASVLHVPVILAFGLYRGGNLYDLYFEDFARQVSVPRGHRQQVAAEYAQKYADRLAHHTRKAPYNWFNFYAFWHK